MGNVVLTRSVCDRCGAMVERGGAEGEVPPVSWAHVRLSVRHEGAGWTENTTHVDGCLSPTCWRKAVALIRGEEPDGTP